MLALSIALLFTLPARGLGPSMAQATVQGPVQGRAPAQQPAAVPDDSGLSQLQAQLRARPQWMEGWWQLSTAAYDANRYDVAVPALEHVVSAAPRMGIAFNLLGLSEFELKHYAQARSHLERAAELANSDDAEVERVAAYHLALLRIRDGDFSKASDLLRAKFGSSPNTQVSYALGLAALRVPLLPEAVDPSYESLLTSVGSAEARGSGTAGQLAGLVEQHSEIPFLHLAYGDLLERDGQTQQALAALRDEARRTPESAVPWTAIERLERAQGHTSAASAAHAKALSLQASEPAVEQRIRSRYEEKAAAPSGEAGLGAAMQAYATGHYADARTALDAWVGQHPTEGTAWAVLGLSEFALGQYDNALLHLQRGEALGLHGDPAAIASAHYTAGVLLLRVGNFDQAAEILTNAHRLVPEDTRIFLALGLAMLHREGLPTESREDKTLLLEAGQIEALLQASRYDEALPRMQALLQQYPRAAFLHYSYGTALIAVSEFDGAAQQMRAEIPLSPNSALPYLRLASIALRQHSPTDALAPAQRALALAPHSAEAHYLLGRALLDTGDSSGAVRELEAARDLNQGSPEVHFNLARAYTKVNRPEAADKERAAFARLNEASQAEKGRTAGHQLYSGPHSNGALVSVSPGAKPE